MYTEYRMTKAVSAQVYEAAAEVCTSLAAAPRVHIVVALCQAERSVADLVRMVGMSGPRLSQHLRVLYQAGLVTRRRDGHQVFYRRVPERTERLCAALQMELGAGAVEVVWKETL
ncbi:MAG: helix-turn-helix transcriptional regulator [Vitreoscilla sp.]|nr:helix-turn-helix transcriptional regulator [Vitreoscilla sp.]